MLLIFTKPRQGWLQKSFTNEHLFLATPQEPRRTVWDNHLGERDGLTNPLNLYELMGMLNPYELKTRLNPYELKSQLNPPGLKSQLKPPWVELALH